MTALTVLEPSTITPAVISRFWAKVDRRGDDECWLWTAAKNADGYGQFKVCGRQHPATRISVAITRGCAELLPGRKILHSCDNPPCVNPRHLSVGTSRMNTQDMLGKGRAGGLLSSADAARSAQAKGAATKRARTEQVRYPALLNALAQLIRTGSPTTFRSVCHLDGYSAARTTLGLSHSQIIEEARKCAV